jgi:hypothetical protein
MSTERSIMENYGTIWVCQDCMLHHANGECISMDDDSGTTNEPLSAIEARVPRSPWAWLSTSTRPAARPASRTGHTPDKCDCETNTYSTSQCEGCRSYLHGERHAMTLFKS